MVSAVHHHRPTVKTSNKSFKSRHATKSSLKSRSKGTHFLSIRDIYIFT